MSLELSQIETLQLVFLAFFALATTLLAVVTLSNALRLRNIRLTWPSGKVFGYPLFATVFFLFATSLAITFWYLGNTHYMVMMLGYSWVGINWMVASYLMSKRYITDNGVVKNINDPSQTIYWCQITDYVEHQQRNEQRFTLLYTDAHDMGSAQRQLRLELLVPRHLLPDFKKILSRKLDGRIYPESIETQGYNYKQIN